MYSTNLAASSILSKTFMLNRWRLEDRLEAVRPFETLDTFTTPAGRRLTLHHRDGDYFIDLDGHELMSTRAPGSEKELAVLGCRHLASAERPRVLIGGLGLGFTLRAALDLLTRDAEVVVAEVRFAITTQGGGGGFILFQHARVAHVNAGAIVT